MKLSMKRFSTVSLDMPRAPRIIASVAISSTSLKYRSIRGGNRAVITSVKSRPFRGVPGLSNMSPAGNRVKLSTKAAVRLMPMIQPKSITGRMPLTTSEPKATMVVITM